MGSRSKLSFVERLRNPSEDLDELTDDIVAAKRWVNRRSQNCPMLELLREVSDTAMERILLDDYNQ